MKPIVVCTAWLWVTLRWGVHHLSSYVVCVPHTKDVSAVVRHPLYIQSVLPRTRSDASPCGSVSLDRDVCGIHNIHRDGPMKRREKRSYEEIRPIRVMGRQNLGYYTYPIYYNKKDSVKALVLRVHRAPTTCDANTFHSRNTRGSNSYANTRRWSTCSSRSKYGTCMSQYTEK